MDGPVRAQTYPNVLFTILFKFGLYHLILNLRTSHKLREIDTAKDNTQRAFEKYLTSAIFAFQV